MSLFKNEKNTVFEISTNLTDHIPLGSSEKT